MVMMQAILQVAADNGGSDCDTGSAGECDGPCAVVAALAQVRPWTFASLQRMLRLADLLVHVSPARGSLVRLLRSAVWDEVCGVLLPLAGVGWGRGMVELGASVLLQGQPPGHCRCHFI